MLLNSGLESNKEEDEEDEARDEEHDRHEHLDEVNTPLQPPSSFRKSIPPQIRQLIVYYY